MFRNFFYLTTLAFLLFFSILTTAIDIVISEPDSLKELYVVAPQGRLYRSKRQFGNHFGASAANANSQAFHFGPQGFDASQAFSGSQSYDFGGHHLNVGYSGSYSANQDGSSGAFAPTFSFDR